MSRGPVAETLMLTSRLIRFRILASQRDWTSRKLYIAAGAASAVLVFLIFISSYVGVRTLVAAHATALLLSVASWAFLVYLFTDLFIAFGQALNDMYLSSDMPILLAMPVRSSSLIVAKFILGVAQNEVYVAVFLLPFIIGYLAGLAAPWWAYPVSMLGLALFPAVLYAGLASVTIVTLRVIPPRAAKEMLWVIGAAVPTTFWLLSFARLAHIQGDITSLQLPVTPLWLPSSWMGHLLAFAGNGDFGRAMAWLGGSAFITLVACPIALTLVSFGFAEGWSRSVSAKRTTAVSSGAPPRLRPIAAIVWKDLSVVIRSPQLWFNHIASLGFIGYLLVGHQVQTPLLPLTVQLAMMQIGFVAVLDGLNPGMTALSLEHRSIWLLESSPLSPRHIFIAKILSAYLQTAAISVVAAVLLGIGYGFGFPHIMALVAFALLVAAATVCFGVAFDTRFPSFDWENPNAINRGVRMIMPFLNALFVLALCGALLGLSRMGYRDVWDGEAGLLLGLAGTCAIVASVVWRTAHQAVRNIAALEI
jgi:ABC-2 type transport system permease protein